MKREREREREREKERVRITEIIEIEREISPKIKTCSHFPLM